MQKNKYLVKGVDLFKIKNRNERRVAKALEDILTDKAYDSLTDESIMDIYALALNALPARYAQIGSIVLRDPVRQEDIEKAIKDSLEKVLNNPKAGL